MNKKEVYVLMKARLFYDKQAKLGEGPLWDPITNRLFYVDILDKKVIVLHASGVLVCEYSLPHMPGCIAFVEGTGNKKLVVAAENCLYDIDLVTKDIEKETVFSEITFPLRFNDGKCDAQGRLVVGTMYRDYSSLGEQGAGALWSIDKGTITALLTGQNIPNGLAWNQEGTILHYIDTVSSAVGAYPYNGLTGQLGSGKIGITIPKAEGSPDGMCMDQQGMLWVAHWGGSRVSRYHPLTGEEIERVEVPSEFVSSCAFGGETMSTLYITTAQNQEKRGGEIYFVETQVQGAEVFSYKK